MVLMNGDPRAGSRVRTEKWVPTVRGKISSNNRTSEQIRGTTTFLLCERPQIMEDKQIRGGAIHFPCPLSFPGRTGCQCIYDSVSYISLGRPQSSLELDLGFRSVLQCTSPAKMNSCKSICSHVKQDSIINLQQHKWLKISV